MFLMCGMIFLSYNGELFLSYGLVKKNNFMFGFQLLNISFGGGGF